MNYLNVKVQMVLLRVPPLGGTHQSKHLVGQSMLNKSHSRHRTALETCPKFLKGDSSF